MKAVSLYALVAGATIAATGLLLGLVFRGAGDGHALVLTSVVALGVQVVSFALLRAWKSTNLWLGWGAGSLLRFSVLAVYALLVVKVLAVPVVPALVGYWLFVFFTMILEPLFLRV